MNPLRTNQYSKSAQARRKLTPLAFFASTFIASIAVGVVHAQNTATLLDGRVIELEERRQTISSLKGAEPPQRDVSDYIADPLAAQQLGKALFWDAQVGSDGGACASCHFAAGADIRITNQVNPGLNAKDATFSERFGGNGPTGPNKTLAASDFPFHRLANPNDRESAVLFDTNDVFSSQGTFGGTFASNKSDQPATSQATQLQTAFVQGLLQLVSGTAASSSANQALSGLVSRLGVPQPQPSQGATAQFNENCSYPYEPAANPFHSSNVISRKVEPRNTPTVVNAVFNYRQFWDGRANNAFNGLDPFGPRTFQPKTDPAGPGNAQAASAGTLVADTTKPRGTPPLKLTQVLIPNASLASQAVGPALSAFEMSCAAKSFHNLGRKMIPLRPLANQKVHIADSLFARSKGLVPLVGRKGLNTTYDAMIRKAFKPKFWSNSQRVRVNPDGSIVADAQGFTQMEQNFSLFWGLAVGEYMAILISDNSPFDRFMNGDRNAMSDRAKAGQVLFLNKGQCANCHYGPVFSAATFTKDDGPAPKVLEHMVSGDGANAFYDSGFYNIGVRPTAEDMGNGGTDGYGFDLSLARQFKWTQLGKKERAPDNFNPTPCAWLVQYYPCSNVPFWSAPADAERDTVDGAFKTPSLRNVGLTPPYFHNGGESNLRDVIRFYSRGGNRRGDLGADTSGLKTPTPFGSVHASNLAPDIGSSETPVPEQHNAILLTEAEIDYLVQFLLALTDERVACHSGIFDHPELPLFMGQQSVSTAKPQVAADMVKVLPAVGRRGLRDIGKPCLPNSGDLFGSVNKDDSTPLQATFNKIIDGSGSNGSPSKEDLQDANNLASGSRKLLSDMMAASIDTVGVNLAATGALTTPPSATGTTGTTTVVVAAVTGAAQPVSATKAGTARATATPVNTLVTAALTVPVPPPVPAPKFTAAKDDIRGFTAIGFLQNATLSNAGCPQLGNANKSQWGGTALVNGLTITIPCNMILQMPAATFTWADLFDPAKFDATQSPPADLTLASSGSGASSNSGPGAGQMLRSSFRFPSTELRILGNIVGGQHIAGLMYGSQQSLNTGNGVITGFDYAKGVIYVGRSATEPVARLQINDPKIKDPSDPAFGTGRYSAGQTPDGRFSVDQQNPTIRAASGYPMCVPRSDPAVADDPLCPQKNRPLAANGCRNFFDAGTFLPTGRALAFPKPDAIYCTGFVMQAPPGTPITQQLPNIFVAGPNDPDARQQAPFEIGDRIDWSGTLLHGDGQGPNGSDTISVHTITSDTGIFTQPGTLPAYLAIGEFAVGTSPPVNFFQGLALAEVDRIILEAFTTDVTSIVDIYLVDLDPITGAETQRWITPGSMTGNAGAPGSTGSIIDGGIVTQFFGAQPGRVRLRANRSVLGVLDSPTRYVRVAARSLCDPGNINGAGPLVGASSSAPVNCLKRAPAANGLFAGQYLAPTPEWVFPENFVPGDPIVPYNLWDLGFLVNGEGPGTGGLTPTPW